MLPLILVAVVQLTLMVIPYFLLNQPIKRLANVSMIIVALLVLPPLFVGNVILDVSKPILTWRDFFTISGGFMFSTIAFLPTAFKSTILLWRHEIRIYEYNRNIMVFLFVALGETLVRLYFGLQKYFETLTTYF